MLVSWALIAGVVMMSAEEKEEFCQLYRKLAIIWVRERNGGLTRFEMEKEAIELMHPAAQGDGAVINKMFSDLVEYTYSYPYPNSFDTEVEAYIMCDDSIRIK